MQQSASQPDEYLLGHSANEEERLRRQPGELASDSRQLLDRLNIRPGDRAIDIGCGPQGIIDLLSERVGLFATNPRNLKLPTTGPALLSRDRPKQCDRSGRR